MTDAQQREAARQFYYRWKDHGNEDEDARSYWLEFLTNILGVERATERVSFEKKVIGADGNTKRIDVYIPETRVLIEQKSFGIALDKPQAGHGGKTPYEQAKEYDNGLPFDEKARWIVTSNFAEIWVYDMNTRRPEPVKLALSDLPAKYHMLDFLVNKETKKVTDEMKLSLDAGRLVGQIYDAFLKQYKNPDDPETLKSLNKLCVRIVFCLYGEDAGIFGKKNMFHDYMAQFDATHARKGLRDLFRVLDQKPEERDPYLSDDDPLLAAFPYVNGGLFSDEDIEIPSLTDEIMALILRNASDSFDWSEISPTIFGAVFESTLNPETRRSGGMHYTSIENIHKVIDPLFLDDLKAELEEIKGIAVLKTKEKRLKEFQDKLASLTFLDPAAGSGNFLTESYLSLRKLENEALRLLLSGKMVGLDVDQSQFIRVDISQFYGIEINDFAVTVARTALWIAENQMMKATEDVVHMSLDFLPLKTNAHIVEGNALRLDWNDVVPKEKLNYIMGNPPFVGKKEQTKQQKQELIDVFGKAVKGVGNLDYVTAWYKKAVAMMIGTPIHAAFVSTNSITQGEQAPVFWRIIFADGIHIDFAYRTFRWDSEASILAHVHCVIVGFSIQSTEKKKRIYIDDTNIVEADNINPYLVDAPTVFIENRSKPLWDVPEMNYGSMPIDDGHLILEKEDVEALLTEDSENERFIRKYVGGLELLRNKDRWCLWLVDAPVTLLRKSQFIMQRIKQTAEFRRASNRPQTLALADTPALFGEIRQPNTSMLVIPKVSSETRRYIPICFVNPEIIVNGSALIIPEASLLLFGVLISNVHMAWMRTVAGRMKSDYQYSGKIVYNNFPWPEPTDEQRARIEQTAQAILDARALYPDASLADLYDPLTMPPELRKAHQNNDRAVMQAYGMPIKETDEAACVAWLMRLYQQKVNNTK
jgi:hypothetical protein